MKKKFVFFGMVLLALLLTTGTFAFTYTNSNTALVPTLANGDFASYQVSPGQPDWYSILPGTSSEILVPNDCGDETQLPTQYPNCNQHWDKVDEQPTDDDGSTYVSTSGSSSWKRDLYQLSNYTIASGDEAITGITVYYRFAAGGSYTVSAKAAIKIDGTVFESTITTRSVTSYATVTWDLATNPSTSAAWTWDEINALQAGVDMKGYSSTKPAICTQVYVKVNYQTSSQLGEVPSGELYVVTPDAQYTGDLLVKVYITNIADLLKAYKFLNMKLYVANSIEAGKSPSYQVLSLENGVAIFNIIGGTGGSYSLVSDNPDEWGTGWTVIPEFYCEVSQR
ncbi:MAG: hypothetical protein ACYDG5_03865 [Dehalococcoidales bacterium]